jgi:hypothetical protein
VPIDNPQSDTTTGGVTAEVDPIFVASSAASVTADTISHADTAYGWGDHSTAGYLVAADLSGYATETYVTGLGYMTASDTASAITAYGYCTLTDVAGVGYVTGTPWESEGYVDDAALVAYGYMDALAVGTMLDEVLINYTPTSGLSDEIQAWFDANGVVP